MWRRMSPCRLIALVFRYDDGLFAEPLSISAKTTWSLRLAVTVTQFLHIAGG